MFVVNLWYSPGVFVLLFFLLRCPNAWEEAPWEKSLSCPPVWGRNGIAAYTESLLGRGEDWRGLWLAGLKALSQWPTSSSLCLWKVPQPSRTAPPAVDQVPKHDLYVTFYIQTSFSHEVKVNMVAGMLGRGAFMLAGQLKFHLYSP